MPLYLGAGDYGAKNRVYFLKSFRQGPISEILSKKRAKKQKKRHLYDNTDVFSIGLGWKL
jgi:hypothetical protein